MPEVHTDVEGRSDSTRALDLSGLTVLPERACVTDPLPEATVPTLPAPLD